MRGEPRHCTVPLKELKKQIEQIYYELRERLSKSELDYLKIKTSFDTFMSAAGELEDDRAVEISAGITYDMEDVTDNCGMKAITRPYFGDNKFKATLGRRTICGWDGVPREVQHTSSLYGADTLTLWALIFDIETPFIKNVHRKCIDEFEHILSRYVCVMSDRIVPCSFQVGLTGGFVRMLRKGTIIALPATNNQRYQNSLIQVYIYYPQKQKFVGGAFDSMILNWVHTNKRWRTLSRDYFPYNSLLLTDYGEHGLDEIMGHRKDNAEADK